MNINKIPLMIFVALAPLWANAETVTIEIPEFQTKIIYGVAPGILHATVDLSGIEGRIVSGSIMVRGMAHGGVFGANCGGNPETYSGTASLKVFVLDGCGTPLHERKWTAHGTFENGQVDSVIPFEWGPPYLSDDCVPQWDFIKTGPVTFSLENYSMAFLPCSYLLSPPWKEFEACSFVFEVEEEMSIQMESWGAIKAVYRD